MNDYESNIFETSDLTSVAVLVSQGIPVHDIDCSNTERVKFTFTKTPQVEGILDSLYKRTLKIDPISLVESQKYIKNVIYNY